MRSEDEDDEEEYEEDNDEENDEDEDEGLVNGGADDEDADNDNDEDGDAVMEDGEDDEEEDEEAEVEGEGEGEGEGDGEAEGDEDEDEEEEEEGDNEDEDEDEEEEDEEGEGEGEGEGEDEEAEDEDEDVEMADEDKSTSPSQTSPSRAKSELVPLEPLPQPAHLVRRSIFTPAWTTPPSSLSIEAIVGIPLPSAVHSIASTACMSYLLAGGQDGHVRAYDFWASVNGGQLMTSQQKAVVGLGEGVSKAGVGRGWWSVEVDGIRDGNVGKRVEPVYSLVCEGDGLWTMAGTQSGPINMYTLRHSPGHQVYALKGHTNVVSCMSLLPDEKGLLSGSWDGTVREWDLNTGQTVRTYPTHGPQLSSLALRPFGLPLSPSPSPRAGDEEDGPRENISVSVGPDFFERKEGSVHDAEAQNAVEANGEHPSAGSPVPDQANVGGDEESGQNESNGPNGLTGAIIDAGADVDMDKASSHDSLFDEDEDADADGVAESDSVAPSNDVTNTATNTAAATPTSVVPSGSVRPQTLALALPGVPRANSAGSAAGSSAAPNRSGTGTGASAPAQQAPRAGAASSIPVLSPATYRQFSDDVLLYSSMDGQVVLIDRRVPSYEGTSGGVGRLLPGERAPPWCMSACWSGDGNQVLAGRRNGTVDIWDVRRSSSSSAPNLLRTLKTPTESGPVSCVVAFPDGHHVATASQDNVRLWNTAEYYSQDDSMKKSKSRPPFKIIAGHHGGTISSMLVDPTSRFLITASGDRGWQGESTRVVLVHEIKW